MQDDAIADQTLFFKQARLPGGWADHVRIGITDGLISRIETEADPSGAESHAVALPGMPNLHSHAFQRGMAGLAEISRPDGDSFWTWRDLMYRFVDHIDPDDLTAIAALAFSEMLESGFTRVGEFHYLHHYRDGSAFADSAEMSQAIMAAAGETGIALTHLPVFYAHADFGGMPPTAQQRRFINNTDQFATLLERIRALARALPDAVVGVAPHSLRAVTPDELAALEQIAQNGPIHIHIAEQRREVDACLAWSGQRPVQWLMDHAAVDARWCLVHATHMDTAEITALAARRAVAGLCPITEANLGDGLFPAIPFLEQGGVYGLGSDSNVLIDMAEEMRLLEYGQRLTTQRRNVLATPGGSTGDTIYGAALAGGAQALGTDAGIAVGHAADIVSLDMDHPAMFGRRGTSITDGFVFAGGKSVVDCVWRRGSRIVQHGGHRDRDRIAARYRQVLARILR